MAGKTGADIEAAKVVGKLVAERASQKGIKNVVFDRGRFDVSRAHQGFGRRCARRRTEFLTGQRQRAFSARGIDDMAREPRRERGEREEV